MTEPSSPTDPPEVVLFDCDGVLVDSDASVARAWTQWAEAYDLDPVEVVERARSSPAADTVAALVTPEQRPDATELIHRLELEDDTPVAAMPGAQALLTSIPPDRWAIYTSAIRPLVEFRVASAGLPRPRHLITADDVARGKPAPEGWLAATALLGADIATATVIEDGGSGIAGAREAGVRRVIGVGERVRDSAIDHHIPDLTACRWTDDALQVHPWTIKETETMRTRQGSMATERPERYAKQLAGHWARKGSADEENGRTVIRFDTGQVVVLRIEPGLLRIEASVPDDSDADQFAQVVKDHLERFGTREELEVIWERPTHAP